MADANSQSKPLPPRAVSALSKVSNWLRDDIADFQTLKNTKICKNIQGLADITAELMRGFAAEVKFTSSENRVTAIRFDEPAIVPVDEGWVVDLIPVHIMGGIAKVNNSEIKLVNYARLREGAEVSGQFFAVLLLSRLADE
ncbi:hypothetical protein F5Y02DRAFT_51855 [Annulohypoxylon stygium]|nr:hypothetical protein F5Y02DRAFT_51855 [Annulohypoxylon stygium]